MLPFRDGKIDSHCRIVMKNFDSVSQLQCFSYVHHCKIASWLTFAHFCKGNFTGSPRSRGGGGHARRKLAGSHAAWR